MSEGVFTENARHYWERNLPVIPVDGKTPIPKGWPGFLGGLPNPDTRAKWLADHPGANIGLLMGFPTNADAVVALDIDEHRFVRMIHRFLGLARGQSRAVLSGKRGKKGQTVFARAPKSLKSTVIKGSNGLGNIDFLAAGRMTVMPPSIHPDTGLPYEPIGTSLLEIDFAELPIVTEHHLKLLKSTLGSEHAVTLLTGKATHDAGVALVAILVSNGVTDEEIADIIVGLLPEDYAGNTGDELPEWISSARAKGFGNQKSETTIAAKVLSLILSNPDVRLFSDGESEGYATMPRSGPTIGYRIRSGAFQMFLRHLAYEALGKPLGDGTLKEITGTLESVALFDSDKFAPHIRIAGNRDEIVIDRGTETGELVRIHAGGWELVQSASCKFVRGSGYHTLPEPVEGGSLRKLQEFLGLDDLNFKLTVAFLVAALKPMGPYFILLVEGEQGSGKSFFCEVLKRIIDPNAATRLRLPDKPQDLMIQAKEYRLLAFDNASGIKADMSDALCTLSTGGGTAVRALYSNGDLFVMSYSRPVIVNGIAGYASRPDLMERSIPIRLTPKSAATRKTEAELNAEFEEILPGVLGAFYDGVAHALRVHDETPPPRHLRMADAARWISAAEVGLGEAPESIIEAIATAQNDFIVERINDDPLISKLRLITSERNFEGYVSELFEQILSKSDAARERMLPKSPQGLSNFLKRMRPALEKAGVVVEFLDKDRKGRRLRITSDRDADDDAPF